MSIFNSELTIKIPFYDLDPMNIVWHGNYIKYMEQARCDMFDKIGYTYENMREDSFAYPIAKMNTKFIRPARFNQEIIIKTQLLDLEPAMNIKYDIYDKESGVKLFTAKTMQIAININTMQSIYVAPAKLKTLLEKNNEN